MRSRILRQAGDRRGRNDLAKRNPIRRLLKVVADRKSSSQHDNGTVALVLPATEGQVLEY
jgi:hypothetical protein